MSGTSNVSKIDADLWRLSGVDVQRLLQVSPQVLTVEGREELLAQRAAVRSEVLPTTPKPKKAPFASHYSVEELAATAESLGRVERIFVSASPSESELVEALVEAMRKMGFSVWCDLERGLDGRSAPPPREFDLLLVFVGSSRVDGIQEELIGVFTHYDVPILPILLASGDPEELARRFGGRRWVDLRQEVEPTEALVRALGDFGLKGRPKPRA